MFAHEHERLCVSRATRRCGRRLKSDGVAAWERAKSIITHVDVFQGCVGRKTEVLSSIVHGNLSLGFPKARRKDDYSVLPVSAIMTDDRRQEGAVALDKGCRRQHKHDLNLHNLHSLRS